MSDDRDAVNYERLCRDIDQKFDAHAAQVADRLRMPLPEYRRGEDWSGGTLWDDFLCRIRTNGSGGFAAIFDRVMETCLEFVYSLPADEQILLWLGTDAFLDQDQPEEIPCDEVVEDALVAELFRRLKDIAGDADSESVGRG